MGRGCRRSSFSLMMSGMGGVDGGRGELVLGGPIGVGEGHEGPSEIVNVKIIFYYQHPFQDYHFFFLMRTNLSGRKQKFSEKNVNSMRKSLPQNRRPGSNMMMRGYQLISALHFSAIGDHHNTPIFLNLPYFWPFSWLKKLKPWQIYVTSMRSILIY